VRGLVRALPHGAEPWMGVGIELDPRVRAFCAGVAKRGLEQAPPDTPRPVVPRLLAAVDEVIERCAEEPRRYLIVVRGRPGGGRAGIRAPVLGRLAWPAPRKTGIELRQGVGPLEPGLLGRGGAGGARGCDPGPDDYDLARRWLARSTTAAIALLDGHQDAPD